MDPSPPCRLPRGFRFDAIGDGQALLVDGRVVADIMPLDQGRCRACLNPLSFSIRYAHFDSMAAAIAYVTDWAIQWEARLRDGVHVPSAVVPPAEATRGRRARRPHDHEGDETAIALLQGEV